jgi:hypothetical protein
MSLRIGDIKGKGNINCENANLKFAETIKKLPTKEVSSHVIIAASLVGWL